MYFSHAIAIQAPVEKVFSYYVDVDKIKLWSAGLEDIAYIKDGDPDNPVGRKFIQKYQMFGKPYYQDGQIVAFEKPNHIAVRVSTRDYTIDVDYRFAPADGGTRVESSSNWVYRSFYGHVFLRLNFFFSRWFLRRIGKRQLERVKQLAEA